MQQVKFTALVVCCLAAGSVTSATEFSYRSAELLYQPFSLDHGDVVPEPLLAQLGAKARFNRSLVKTFACMEEIYRDDKLKRSFDYLLDESPRGDLTAIRFKGRSKAGFADSFPPAFAWSLLFDEANRPYMTFRYLGESLENFDLVHRISFRGSLPFRQGSDVREWEGVVLVDAVTLGILTVEAAPRIYSQILDFKLDRYRRSFKLVFFGRPIRFRRAPKVQTLRIEFTDVAVVGRLSEASEGEAVSARFPSTLAWRNHKVNARGEFRPKKLDERRYREYRFFETGTRSLEYGAALSD